MRGCVLPPFSILFSTELNSLICVCRYNEKQARIAERRRLNFEKKLAVSLKTNRNGVLVIYRAPYVFYSSCLI